MELQIYCDGVSSIEANCNEGLTVKIDIDYLDLLKLYEVVKRLLITSLNDLHGTKLEEIKINLDKHLRELS